MLVTLLAALFSSLCSGGAPIEMVLANGLKLVVVEDHRAPVVVSQLWYKVGSSYEHDGLTGISHALEHMLFKGTARHGLGEFSRIVAFNGGRSNAFTGNDYTTYHQQFEASRLVVSFELEADRMRNALLDDEEFAKEIKVVMEERRLRTEDNPKARARELLGSQAYQTSGYRHPVVGWMADLEGMRTADLRSWYDQWYAPNNAVLVVSGYVNAPAVKQLAEQYFGPVAAREVPRPRSNQDTAQIGARAATLQSKVSVPYLLLSYKAPGLKHFVDGEAEEQWQAYALELLAHLLGNEQTGLLVKALVRESESATKIGVHYDLYQRVDGLFTIAATPALDQNLDELERQIRLQLARLAASPFAADDLARAKVQIKARQVYQRDSLFYQAMQIGILESVGLDWRERDNYLPSIEQVTAAQIQTILASYLIETRETVVRSIAENKIDAKQ